MGFRIEKLGGGGGDLKLGTIKYLFHQGVGSGPPLPGSAPELYLNVCTLSIRCVAHT